MPRAQFPISTFLGSQLVTRSRGGSPQNCVIFLHGSGDTGENIGRCVDSFFLNLPETVVFYPTAPLRPYTLNEGCLSRVWHDRKELSLDGKEDAEGIERMSRNFVSLLNDINEKLGIPNSRIVVGGFSQGGHLSLQLGFRNFFSEPVAGVFALSAFLANNSVVYDEMRALKKQRNIPLFMAHGSSDELVEFGWGQRTFERVVDAGDVKMATFRRFQGFHHIDVETMEILASWITQRFSPLASDDLGQELKSSD